MQLTPGARAMTTRHQADRTEAIDAFIDIKAEIDAMLGRLAALSADHFECAPEAIDWRHVGTLQHFGERLREISDMAFREGEHSR